jgi:hypothetical protein
VTEKGGNWPARAASYLWHNAVWWLVPLAIILATLLVFALLTNEPADPMPSIYQRP